MAWHRLEHARSRVNELERLKTKHLQGRPGAATTAAPRPGATLSAGNTPTSQT